jgi:hypothetical protein
VDISKAEIFNITQIPKEYSCDRKTPFQEALLDVERRNGNKTPVGYLRREKSRNASLSKTAFGFQPKNTFKNEELMSVSGLSKRIPDPFNSTVRALRDTFLTTTL